MNPLVERLVPIRTDQLLKLLAVKGEIDSPAPARLIGVIEHRQYRPESRLSGDGLLSYSPKDPADEALGYGCGADARVKPPDFSPGGL